MKIIRIESPITDIVLCNCYIPSISLSSFQAEDLSAKKEEIKCERCGGFITPEMMKKTLICYKE